MKYQPITVLKWIFGLGWVIVFPTGIDQLWSIQLSQVDLPGYLLLLYVATATTVFAYYLNVKAIKHVSSTIVGYYAYLHPLFAGFIEILASVSLSMLQVLVEYSQQFKGNG